MPENEMCLMPIGKTFFKGKSINPPQRKCSVFQ